jgi:hypothetical protein
MINPTTISERLLFSTVRIEATLQSGGTSIGTGFFFDFLLPDQRKVSTIITNKHVINEAVRGLFYVHETEFDPKAKPSGRSHPVNLPIFSSFWIPHPSPKIDLCAMIINPLINQAQQQGISIFYRPLNENFILPESKLEELSAVEDILMVGYPNGLWDEVNNLPLIRRGITATHPAVDFRGESMTVIDAACFPGSSGSPVLLISEETYKDKSGTFIGDTAILLGVLAAGPFLTEKGEIVIKGIPTNNQFVSLTRQMIHLGYIIKAREIQVLGEAVKKFGNLGRLPSNNF